MKQEHIKIAYLNCLMALCMVFTKHTSGQFKILPTDTTFIQVRARYANMPVDTSRDSDYSRWKRYEAFWSKRLMPGGSFKYYNAAKIQFFNSLNSNNILASQPGTINFGNWQSKGPTSVFDNVPNSLSLGRLDRVQVDPDDALGKTMYVAGFGGVFKTTDGGANWINLYTDYAFGTTEVSEIRLVKDPNPPYDKYLYAAAGGGVFSPEKSVPFAGIFKFKLDNVNTSWTNITGNLTCAGMMDQGLSSGVYKILVDPTNITNIFLATSQGVFYTCNTGCTPPNLPCIVPGTVWKKSNLNVPVIGLEFDYSVPGYKALYCSFRQIWRTNDILNQNFNVISSTNSSFNNVFNNLTSLPSGISFNVNDNKDCHINITTHPSNPNKVYACVSMNGCLPPTSSQSFNCNDTKGVFVLEYDKTNVTPFPNNFVLKKSYYGNNLHGDKNFIHISPYNTNLLSYNTQYWGVNEVLDLNTNSIVGSFSTPHADSHDFDFTPNNFMIGSNDGGVFKVQVLPSVSYLNAINGAGMSISKMSGGSVWEKTGNHVVTGHQDNDIISTANFNNPSTWYKFALTGDGGLTEYIPRGQYYMGSLYNVLFYFDPYNIYQTNQNYPSIYPTCAGFKIGPNYMKNVNAQADLYFGAEELLYVNPYNNTTSGCASASAPVINWNTLSNFNNLNANPACYQNFVSSFDISSDQKTIYAARYNNAIIYDATCQSQAANGNYVQLFKTTQGGINNPNITNPCSSGCWTPIGTAAQLNIAGQIGAIAMHPTDPNQVWVGGSAYVPANSTARRVIYSADGGATWTDFSLGLPNTSVSELIVRKGTDYEIFAATDLGVYYRTKTMNHWERVSVNLPYVSVFDIQIDNCNNKLYAYTYGRGMWSIDLPNTNNPGPMPSVTLSQNTTYTGIKYILNDIIVPNGVQLTLNSATVYMGNNTSIIVQPGARLDIISTTIQGYCDKTMWQHILVDGNGALPQAINSVTNFYPNHGVVYVNNSTIKDAWQAAITSQNGGVINAQTSSFINNRKGLEFHSFGFPNNQCKITKCIFNTTSNLKDPSQGIDAHVTAWAVDGVRFYGCTFQNTAPAGSNFNTLGNGIYSIDAFYYIDNYCPGSCATTPATVGRSLFKNLNYGIYAETYSSSLKTLSLRNTDFNNCSRGTYFKAVDFASVQYCNYTNIPDVLSTSGANPYGLYYDNCQNLFCENNNFSGVGVNPVNNTGLVINNANTGATRGYYCDFVNLKVGSGAYFDNYNNSTGTGLRYNCNKYSGNGYDVVIMGGTTNANTDVDHVQGSWNPLSTNPQQNLIRNLYSASCVANANNQWFDDRQGTPAVVQHANHSTQSGNGGTFYTAPQPGCYDATKLGVSYIPAQNFTRNQTSCPTFSSGTGCATCNPAIIAQSISANKQNLASATTALNSTAGSMALTTNAAGNAQAINQQNALANITSQLSYLYNQKIRLFMADTLYKNNDSLLANLQASNYADKQVKILDHYINTRKYALAAQQANSLSSSPTYSQYAQFKNYVITALSNTLGINSLKQNTAAKNHILALANTDFAIGQQQAQALAGFVWGNKYYEPIMLPIGNSASRQMAVAVADSSLNTQTTGGSYLNAIPNPASNMVTIEYALPDKALSGKLIITDVTGKTVQYYEVIASLSKLEVQTSTWPNGVYFYTLYANNKQVETKKIVIIK